MYWYQEMYLSKQHKFHIYEISQSDLQRAAISQSDLQSRWVKMQCSAVHGMAVDAYFLEYNSPRSQMSSLKIQHVWLMMPISWNYYSQAA